MQEKTAHLPRDIIETSIKNFPIGETTRIRHAEVLGLKGSAGAAFVAKLLLQTADNLIVLAPDHRTAELFYKDLIFHHGARGDIFFFPHWGINPYEPLNPHLEIEAIRIVSLAALQTGTARVVVLPARALMQRVIPRRVVEELRLTLEPDREYPREELLNFLFRLGYSSMSLVEERGTFSVRGDILDIFPPTTLEPVRVEFFGDLVERIRPFDPVSQRTSRQELKNLAILPVREMILTESHLEIFSRRLKKRCDELALPRPLRESILADISEGLMFPGCASLLPLNYERLDSFFDYVADSRWIILDPPEISQELERFFALVQEGAARAAEKAQPFADPDEFYLSCRAVEENLAGRKHFDISSLDISPFQKEYPVFHFQTLPNHDLRQEVSGPDGGAGVFAEHVKKWLKEGWQIVLVCHQQGQAERLKDILENRDLVPDFLGEGVFPQQPGTLAIVLGELSAGFRIPEEKLAIITEEELFGGRARRKSGRKGTAKGFLSSFSELREGDHVVHADHGIARYHGLVHLKTKQVEGDYLNLEYAGGDKLYLPVDRIEKVQKYIGAEGYAPRLDKMGGNAWEKAVLKARAAVEELAGELLKIYARREMSQGFRYSPPDPMFREFEAAFLYDETEDQLTAIQDVLKDMQESKPMDRLICGDVGYGKTEVAIRAAFKAVMDGKQVSILVPTTVLAQQHLDTFRERFKDYPVVTDMISRFRSKGEQGDVLSRTAAGKVDILIGTHRLLQRDVHFKDLGLLIIDEEQRFGVKHKEKLKKFRAEVDLLTLTATPIPRTLHMSLSGLRDLSIIGTPPVDRQAIRTYVTKFDDSLIREAIMRELRRGGQVFFVHNRVHTINAMAAFLRELIPEARLAVGHGQMPEKELEEVMFDFVEGKSNLLVCTTIIENGLDIPRANTIIINRADCFGLSQLYQLRGRVGRSHQRAYAYLLIPSTGAVTREARQRLKVLQELTELGAGFTIASHDLELRGAGELLGARQSGQVAAVGFEMYAELLEETIHEMKGLEHKEEIDPEIKLGLSAFLPEKFVPDPNQRLVFYKKLSAAEDDEELFALMDELRDRFGKLPDPALLLFEIMKLRVLMKRLKITLAEYDGNRIVFGFHSSTPVEPEKILALIEKQASRYSISPDYRLFVRTGRLEATERLKTAKKELLAFL